MINIAYQRLFNLKISHDYYKNGLAKGVHLIPTKKTVGLLKNGKMLLKHLANQIVVLYRGLNEIPPVNPPKPFIDLGKDFKFTFAIEVENKAEFLNITKLNDGTEIYESGKIIYFKNDPTKASPEDITHTLIDSIRSSLFTYQFQLPTGTGDVDIILLKISDNESETKVPTGKNALGQNLPLNYKLEQHANTNYSHAIDTRNLPYGKYKIKITTVGDETDIKKEELIYIHDELAQQAIFGIVDILYDTTNDKAYGITEEYNIVFSRKAAFWKYFLVEKEAPLVLPTYSIAENGLPVAPYGANTFSKITTTEVNGNQATVFRSNAEIIFYEIPKLKIELKEGATIKIANLPNASPNNIIKKNGAQLESEIYVFL